MLEVDRLIWLKCTIISNCLFWTTGVINDDIEDEERSEGEVLSTDDEDTNDQPESLPASTDAENIVRFV